MSSHFTHICTVICGTWGKDMNRERITDKICGLYSWAGPLQSYRTWTGSKKRGEWALDIISVPCRFGDAAGTSGVKRTRSSPESCSSFPGLPCAYLQLMLLLESPFQWPVWHQAFCHCHADSSLLVSWGFSAFIASPQQQRWWMQKVCCLYLLFERRISISHPSLLTLYKGRDRIAFLIKPDFLYLLVWRSLLIIVSPAAVFSASRWIARPFLQSDSFLNLVSQELKTSVVSCCLNIPSGLLVRKGYGFCGVITYHLMSLPVQGKAWSFCNKRHAWEMKETKQNPWIKIFCIFSVLHRERSQWPNLCFQPSLAVGWRAWQRQSHNYILIKTNKVGK